jgi:hypothetical protein
MIVLCASPGFPRWSVPRISMFLSGSLRRWGCRRLRYCRRRRRLGVAPVSEAGDRAYRLQERAIGEPARRLPAWVRRRRSKKAESDIRAGAITSSSGKAANSSAAAPVHLSPIWPDAENPPVLAAATVWRCQNPLYPSAPAMPAGRARIATIFWPGRQLDRVFALVLMVVAWPRPSTSPQIGQQAVTSHRILSHRQLWAARPGYLRFRLRHHFEAPPLAVEIPWRRRGPL